MGWEALAVGAGLLVGIGLVVVLVMRRSGRGIDREELDPFFIPAIALVGTGSALITTGVAGVFLIAFGGVLLIVALTRMRDRDHRS